MFLAYTKEGNIFKCSDMIQIALSIIKFIIIMLSIGMERINQSLETSGIFVKKKSKNNDLADIIYLTSF